MLGRIVEIAESGRHLSLHRGFMKVSFKGETICQIPIDELLGVVVSGRGTTHSTNLLARFAELGVGFSITNNNFYPVAIMLPLNGNTYQSKRMRLQADTPLPTKKRLWKDIVQTKIKTQANVLEQISEPVTTKLLFNLIHKVRSGDPDNIEAQAAKIYWPALFGKEFRRRKNAKKINGLLNYGYSIIRTCMARAVIGVGLHPTLGFGHTNPNNSMCVVDDFMEPYRPWCDLFVHCLVSNGIKEVTNEAKHLLASLTILDISGSKGVTTLFTSMTEVTSNCIKIMEKRVGQLYYPEIPSKQIVSYVMDNIKE